MRCTRMLSAAAAITLAASMSLLAVGTANARPPCDGPDPAPICGGPITPPRPPAIPDLSIALAANANQVGAGQPLTYTVTVHNAASTLLAPSKSVGGLAVRLTLGAGASLMSASATNGLSCAASGTVLSCGSGTLAAGGTATITVNTRAPSNPGSATANAVVDPANAVGERNESNNSASASTTVTALPDLTVSMTGPATIAGLRQVGAWRITVRNVGAAPVTGMNVRWLTNWGGDVNANHPTGDGFTCSVPPEYFQQIVYCYGSGVTLAPGQSVTIVINAVPPAPDNLYGAFGAGVETATVDYGEQIAEANEANNAATVYTTLTW